MDSLDIKPSLYELTLEERANLPAFLNDLPLYAQFTQLNSGAAAGSAQSGSAALSNPAVNLPG